MASSHRQFRLMRSQFSSLNPVTASLLLTLGVLTVAIAPPHPLLAAPAVTQTSETAAELRQRGLRLHYAGQLTAALATLQSALAQAQQHNDIAAEADARVAIAEVYVALNDKMAVVDAIQPALSLYRELNDPVGEARALQVLSFAQFQDTPSETALATAEQALSIAREQGSSVLQGLILADIGSYYVLLQDFETVLAYLDEAQTLLALEPSSVEEGLRRDYYQSLVKAIRGLAWANQGNAEQALADLDGAIALSQSTQNPFGEAIARLFKGIVLNEQGQTAAAVSAYQQAADLFAAVERPLNQFNALTQMGSMLNDYGLAIRQNNRLEAAIAAHAQAIAAYDEALPIAQSLGPKQEAMAQNGLATGYIFTTQNWQRQANSGLEASAFEVTQAATTQAIESGQQGVAAARVAIALAPFHRDQPTTSQSQTIAYYAHLASGQAYEAQIRLDAALGEFARALEANEWALAVFQAGLPYAVQSKDPDLIAQGQSSVALAYNGVSQLHNAGGDYDSAIAASREAMKIAESLPARGLQLLVLTNRHQHYFDASEQSQAAGDIEAGLDYMEQAADYAQQMLALAEAPLQVRADIAVADALVDSHIIDTEEERQYWLEQALQANWTYLTGLGFIYDEQDDYAQGLEFHQQALTIAERRDEPLILFVTLGSISAFQVRLSQYPEALQIEERMAAIAEQLADPQLRLASYMSRANIYDDLGRYPEAIAAYESALPLAQSQKQLAREGIILNNVGLILTQQGNYDEALVKFDQDLGLTRTIRAELESPDALTKLEDYCYLTASGTGFDSADASVETAAYAERLAAESAEYQRQLCIDTSWDSEQKTLNNIALVYDGQGRYADALALYEQSLAINAQWGDRFNEAKILSNIGNLYMNQGDYRQALANHEDALAIRQEIGDRSGVAVSLNSLGVVYQNQGRYDEALLVYQEAFGLIQELSLKPLEPTVLGNIGSLYSDRGQYGEAQRYYEQSLGLSRELNFLPDEASELRNLGLLAADRGDYAEALDFAEQSLAIRRHIGARIGVGTVLRDIGYVRQTQGDFADAFTVHQEALTIAQDLADRDDEAAALLALGSTYETLGQYPQATTFYTDALTIFQEIGNVAGAAAALQSLGNTADAQGQHAEALQLYEQAIAIHQNTGSVAGESTVLIDIGFVQTQLGNLTAAETSLRQALQLQQQTGARANEGTTLAGLALVKSEQADPEAALALLQQSLVLHQELGDRPNTAGVFSEMGQLLASQDQPELAILWLKQSVNRYEAIRGDLDGLDRELQTAYTESIAATYRTLADLLLSQNRVLEAQRVLDLLKVQELDEYFQDVQRSSQTVNGIDLWQVETDLLALYQQILDQTSELQRLEAQSPDTLTSAEQSRLSTLQADRDRAESWFYDFLDDPAVIDTVDQIRANSRGQNLEPENFPDLANNLRLLPQKTAALYPLILEDRLELVLVMPDGPPLRYPVAVTAQDLNQAIVDFGQALKDPDSAIQTSAQQLYTWLIAPLAEQLEQADIESIIYAPDGALRYVPLAALYDGEQYLAEQYAISYITAASLTDLNVPPPNSDRRLLAAACAECEFTIDAGGTQFKFPDLPFTELEVQTLAEQVDGTDVLLNEAFNADALNNLASYDIVHLATHAAFVIGSPDESFIVFGSGETINLRNIKREWTLDNAELVVLSACETAVGSTDLGTGIEILGLGYRIEQAGAQATLASLWQVSDGGTQLLMQAFYEALQADMTKSEALQTAQRAMITGDAAGEGGDRGLGIVPRNNGGTRGAVNNTLAHPYYWAPFILIGNGL